MADVDVNLQYLENLARHTREVESTLRRFATLTGSALNSSPDVNAAYQDLGWRWDQRRDELAAALAALADGFDTTRLNFERTDAELASALEEGE
jgi:ABC-type transporter Mla subunit MlaD